MGGNVFKDLDGKVLRLSKQEYKSFVNDILHRFNQKNMIITEIKSYNNKETFGDCDLLHYADISLNDILAILGNPRYSINGDVISFAMPIDENYFQLDLIKVKQIEYPFANNYFSYNDAGNFMGRIFHRMGFKFGHRGLSYVIRDVSNPTYAIKEVLVSLDWNKVLIFGGYNPDVWNEGFNTTDEIFKYVVTSEYASRQIFNLNEVSHKARIRDRKRINYKKLLSWINDPKNAVLESEKINKNELCKIMLNKSFDVFPDFKERYDEEISKNEKRKIIKEKFNGMIVGELTGLTGKDLGRFIEKYKFRISDFEQFVLQQSEENIKNSIIFFKNNYF